LNRKFGYIAEALDDLPNATVLDGELDPDGGLAFGLCDLGMGEPELGYVSLIELTTVRVKLSLPFVRNLHFEAEKSISSIGRVDLAFRDPGRALGCTRIRPKTVEPAVTRHYSRQYRTDFKSCFYEARIRTHRRRSLRSYR
jgi:hypothetical protein